MICTFLWYAHKAGKDLTASPTIYCQHLRFYRLPTYVGFAHVTKITTNIEIIIQSAKLFTRIIGR